MISIKDLKYKLIKFIFCNNIMYQQIINYRNDSQNLRITKRLKKKMKNSYKHMFIYSRPYNSDHNKIVSRNKIYRNFYNTMNTILLPKDIADKILEFLSECVYLEDTGLKNPFNGIQVCDGFSTYNKKQCKKCYKALMNWKLCCSISLDCNETPTCKICNSCEIHCYCYNDYQIDEDLNI